MEVPQLFALTDVADTWPEAGLLDACMYLRGSKHLRVSSRWKTCFPTEIWQESPGF